MSETYLTTDTWLAAFFVTSGAKLDRLEPHSQNRRKIQFHFSDRNQCAGLFSQYHAGNGAVSPLKYKQVFEGLMEQVHNILKAQPKSSGKN